MPRITAQLFSEIVDACQNDIKTFETVKALTKGTDVPTAAEYAAIERVQKVLKDCSSAITLELAHLQQGIDNVRSLLPTIR